MGQMPFGVVHCISLTLRARARLFYSLIPRRLPSSEHFSLRALLRRHRRSRDDERPLSRERRLRD